MLSKFTKRIFIISSIIVLLLLLGIAIGQSRQKNDVLRSIDLFSETLSYIKNRYVEPVDDSKLFNGALHGLAENVDPESFYFDPADYDEYIKMNKQMPTNTTGLHLVKINRYLRVISIDPGSPADKAGVESGDYITHINNIPGFDLNLFTARKLLSGDAGSAVEIDVIDGITGLERKLKLKHVELKDTGLVFDTINKNLLYIKIYNFNAANYRALEEVLKNNTSKQIIIDLRNNYRGEENGLISMLDLFLDDDTVVYFKKLPKDVKIERRCVVGKVELENSVYLLINESTTHFAEIFSLVLDEKGIAITVGRKTPGLTSEQSDFKLTNGGAIYLTSTLYLTPNGKNYYLKGLDPKIVIQIEDNNSNLKKYRVITDNKKIDSTDELLYKSIKQIAEKLNKTK